jgi:hypothetical protein
MAAVSAAINHVVCQSGDQNVSEEWIHQMTAGKRRACHAEKIA